MTISLEQTRRYILIIKICISVLCLLSTVYLLMIGDPYMWGFLLVYLITLAIPLDTKWRKFHLAIGCLNLIPTVVALSLIFVFNKISHFTTTPKILVWIGIISSPVVALLFFSYSVLLIRYSFLERDVPTTPPEK